MNTYCGPDASDCVANQTLEDTSCLAPCTGLYADVADDTFYQLKLQTMTDLVKSLEDNMIKGKGIKYISKTEPFLPFLPSTHPITLQTFRPSDRDTFRIILTKFGIKVATCQWRYQVAKFPMNTIGAT